MKGFSKAVDATKVLSKSPEVLETTVEGQPVLLHSKRWQYVNFTGSGAAVWQALANPMRLDAVIADLLSRFDVDEATCRRETSAFVEKLLDEEFLIAS